MNDRITEEDWMNLPDRLLDNQHIEDKRLFQAQQEEMRRVIRPIKHRVRDKIALVRGAIGKVPYEDQEVVSTGEVARFRNALMLAGDNEAREQYADLEVMRIFGEMEGRRMIGAINKEYEEPK